MRPERFKKGAAIRGTGRRSGRARRRGPPIGRDLARLRRSRGWKAYSGLAYQLIAYCSSWALVCQVQLALQSSADASSTVLTDSPKASAASREDRPPANQAEHLQLPGCLSRSIGSAPNPAPPAWAVISAPGCRPANRSGTSSPTEEPYAGQLTTDPTPLVFIM